MDTLVLLELTDNLTEALAELEKAKDDTLAMLDAIDAVNDALIALGGNAVSSVVNDYTELLKGIISGTINVFVAKEKLVELEKALTDLGGDDMSDGDNKQLMLDALKAAAKQVIEGQGYQIAA